MIKKIFIYRFCFNWLLGT